MIKFLVKFFAQRFLSCWVVLIFDILTISLSFVISYFLRYNFNNLLINTEEVKIQSVFIVSIYLLSFAIIKPFRGILRHSGFYDAFLILKATLLASILLIVSNIVSTSFDLDKIYIIPYSILVIQFLLSMSVLIGSRVVAKLIYIRISRQFITSKVPVIIYGAGDAGMLTKNALIKDVVYKYEVVAYIDDNTSKINKRLEGIPVYHQKKVLNFSFIKDHEIKQLIIAIQDLNPEKKKKIVEKGLELDLQVKVVPAINLWIDGELSSHQLRNVKIEELLERETIEIESINIERELKNKIVLVTGGAGSIGSEIVRQVLTYNPKRLIILDQAESPIYDLQFEIKNNQNFKNLLNRTEFIIANIKDKFRMDGVFDLYRPDIIYHAAAYKHVPLMEENPYEALMANIFGTKNIADLALKYSVEKFVMISTDKAVNPTNIMGASKRIAEIYTQSLRSTSTQFITTRFGNVLGSNGSVIPLFRKQIQSGGPVTLTHKDITRYFMTIPEACSLVLEAGAMGKGGEIFVFDMGKPVKIYEMAMKMIKLSGLIPDKDIKIIETGLRPGEKLYEELLTDSEKTLPTHHPKIMRAKVDSQDKALVDKYLHELSEIIIENDDFKLVDKMKTIVPEFKSNNSIFKKLDH